MNDIRSIKDSIIQSICGKDISYAKNFVEQFGEDIDKVDESQGKEFVLILKYILNENDENKLNLLYETFKNRKIDTAIVERELKEYFAKELIGGLYDIEDKQEINPEDLPEELKDIGVPIYDAGTDFNMLICAQWPAEEWEEKEYGKGFINRWKNKSDKFCTSYIRNDMISTVKHNNIVGYMKKHDVCFRIQ